MSQFGQSLPATPQIYTDADVYQYTKAGFVSHLVRALETVGMEALRPLWPYDPIANPEQVLSDSLVPDLFPFDYPDSSTFTFNNELWRPCVVIANFHGDYSVSTPLVESYNDVCLFDAIRRDAPAQLDDIYISNRHRGVSTNYGFDSAAASSEYGYDMRGARAKLQNWKPFDSHAGVNNVNLLSVGNWYVYLGKAGLFVYVGDGPTRAQFGTHMACGFVFAGGRIPGRELTVDVNINRINPIIPMYFSSEDTELAGIGQWKTDSEFYESTIHGIQYDLKSQTYPVRAECYNLENVEYPIFPFYKPWTAPSPRAVSGGGGAHILGRLVVVPTSREDNAGDLYGRLVNSLSSSQTRPLWGEVFTAPGFRWCDLAAPLGLHEDPITLTDWYLVPTYNSDSMVGLFYENANEVSELASLTRTLVGDDYYRMDGTPGFDFPNIAGGLTAPTVTVTTTQPTWGEWDDSSASDLVTMYNDIAYAGGSANSVMEWVITPPGADAADTLYEVSFEARNRDDATTEGSCPLTFSIFVNGVWTDFLVLNSAGTNAAAAGYDFTEYTFDIPIDSTVTASRTLKCRWRLDRTGVTEGNTATVQNVHIKKYRYL